MKRANEKKSGVSDLECWDKNMGKLTIFKIRNRYQTKCDFKVIYYQNK